ncbi:MULTISPECIES: hypothetical protein [unclassified Paenibacillus]|uniref:hypothetical protein n=1 Tax=unclassified Paenibacillus TaxID=185978 RepID=UPI003626F196
MNGLGRSSADQQGQKKDAAARNSMEGKFGEGKRWYGPSLIRAGFKRQTSA